MGHGPEFIAGICSAGSADLQIGMLINNLSAQADSTTTHQGFIYASFTNEQSQSNILCVMRTMALISLLLAPMWQTARQSKSGGKELPEAPPPSSEDMLDTGKEKLKPNPDSGRCGSLVYYIYEYEYWTEFANRLVIRNNKGKLIKRLDIGEGPSWGVKCTYGPVKGIRTAEFSFGGGGSGFTLTNVLFRANPPSFLLSYTWSGHLEYFNMPREEGWVDLNGDGQRELVIRDGGIGYALCKSCDYDADTIRYVLCYEAGVFEECTARFPEYIHPVIEKGFLMLHDRSEKRHRFAWSLFILFHAVEIGESASAWPRLKAELPPEMYQLVWNKRGRIDGAIVKRKEKWRNRTSGKYFSKRWE